MMIRALMLGIGLSAILAAGGTAQTSTSDTPPAAGSNLPPTENAIAPDGTSKVPNNVPEIICPPGVHRYGAQAVTDPLAVLASPMVAQETSLKRLANENTRVRCTPDRG